MGYSRSLVMRALDVSGKHFIQHHAGGCEAIMHQGSSHAGSANWVDVRCECEGLRHDLKNLSTTVGAESSPLQRHQRTRRTTASDEVREHEVVNQQNPIIPIQYLARIPIINRLPLPLRTPYTHSRASEQ